MFLQSATKQQAQAFNRLSIAEMKPLLECIQSELDAARAQLAKADDLPRIYRLQGRVAVLEDFLQAVEKAPSILR